MPDELDEEDLQAELDALADDLEGEELGGEAVPSYLQTNTELPDFVDELPNQGMAEGASAEHGRRCELLMSIIFLAVGFLLPYSEGWRPVRTHLQCRSTCMRKPQ